jgi:hypothetical protein
MLRLFENSEKILAVMSAEEKQDLHKVRDQARTASLFGGSKVGRSIGDALADLRKVTGRTQCSKKVSPSRVMQFNQS